MGDKHSGQKILVYITLAVVLLIGSATTVVAWRTHENGKRPAAATRTTLPAADKNTSAIAPISYQGEDGKTALELLKQKATVVTKDSSYGQYVDSINGVAGGTGGKYWTFYINGQQASVGAGAYTTKATDTITWKFE
jgi:uncharacterized protein DUF4430